jgi:hypothetical protein
VVPEGTNTLEWVYVKDVTRDEGEDAVYLDNLNLPVYRPTPQEPLLLTVGVDGATLHLLVEGVARGRYRIESSTNLVDWETLTTLTADSDGRAEVTKTDDSQPPKDRFYRAVGI